MLPSGRLGRPHSRRERCQENQSVCERGSWMAEPRRLFAWRRDRVTPTPLDEELAFRAFVRRKSGNVSEETLNRYWNYVANLKEWLDGEDPTPANVDAYHGSVLMKKYVPNSRVPICSALNWWLRFRKIRDEEDEPLRPPIPETGAAEEPRTLSDAQRPSLRRPL